MASLADRMLASRDSWCELEPAKDGKPAKRVSLRRPPQTQIVRMRDGVGEADVFAAAVAWEGFTEADLLGSAVGAADPAPFSREVWAIYIQDNAEQLVMCSQHLLKQITDHIESVKEARKN